MQHSHVSVRVAPAAQRNPLAIGADSNAVRALHVERHDERQGAPLQHPDNELPRLFVVVGLQALQGVCKGTGRVLLQLQESQGRELAGFRTPGFVHRPFAGSLDHGQPGGQNDEKRGNGDSPPPSLLPGAVHHGTSEGLFGRRETPGVAFAPRLVLLVRRPGPEQIRRLAAVLPHLRHLAQLIPQLRAVGVLSLPAHEPRPGRQQGFVDDLDAVRRFGVAFPRHFE